MAELKFHEEKAIKLMLKALKAYKEKTHLFSRIHVEFGSAPQHLHKPKGLDVTSYDYRLWLFFTTVLTYRSKSELWFKQSVKLHEAHPELYTEGVLEVGLDTLCKRIQQAGFIYPNEGGKRWFGTAKTLFSEELKGEPLNLLTHSTVNEFLQYKKRLKKNAGGKEQLPGIGHKIYSLMVVLFGEIEELGVSANDGIPIDIHLSRIMIAHGAVTGTGVVDAQKVAEFLRGPFSKVCKDHEVTLFDAAHALWFLGRFACYNCSRIDGIHEICPLALSCGGSPNTAIRQQEGRWDLDAPPNSVGTPRLQMPEFVTDRYYVDKLLTPSEKSKKEKTNPDFGKAPKQKTLNLQGGKLNSAL